MPFTFPLQWSLPDDSAFSFHAQTVITQARMQALLLGALKIESAEFFAYLPEVEVCPWLKDIAPRTGAGVTESLGVMFAKAAWGFGDNNKAIAHAKGVMAASYLDAPATAIYRKSHAKALAARLLADTDTLVDDDI